MKGRVAKKVAQARVDTIREAQTRITPEKLTFFMGKTVEVLVEEVIPGDDDAAVSATSTTDPAAPAIPASRLALGRAWFQAPEVDGSVVLQYEENQRDLDGNPIGPGSVVEAVIMNVNGIDVEAVAR
jgi:ribosomal protein S12 methylthiotransferase